MRGLLLLSCLAIANAAQLGYDYRAPGQHVATGGERNRGSSGRERSSESDIINNKSNKYNNNNDNDALNELSSRFVGLTGGATNADDHQLPSDALNLQATQPTVQFNKEFYAYTAPEDDFNDNEALQRITSSLKRNLRVVFIKSPEQQGLTNAALQLAKQASEQRTAIYVLSKQTDIGALAERLQTVRHSASAHKPEVHFVKYRTQDDALRAQQQIQAQYETLGGSTRSSDEGVAPVLDFAMPLSNAEATYLPPALS